MSEHDHHTWQLTAFNASTGIEPLIRITFLHAGSHGVITTKGDAAGVGTAIIRVAVSVVALFIKVLVVVWLRDGSNGCSQDVDGVGTRHLAPESRDLNEKATAGRKGLARTGQMEPAVVALNTPPSSFFGETPRRNRQTVSSSPVSICDVLSYGESRCTILIFGGDDPGDISSPSHRPHHEVVGLRPYQRHRLAGFVNVLHGKTRRPVGFRSSRWPRRWVGRWGRTGVYGPLRQLRRTGAEGLPPLNREYPGADAIAAVFCSLQYRRRFKDAWSSVLRSRPHPHQPSVPIAGGL